MPILGRELTVELGYLARSIKEQFTELSDEIAVQFDKDNEAISYLRMRGYLSDSAKRAVVKKLVKNIELELKRARYENHTRD